MTGMCCPECECEKSRVTDSRPAEGGIKRRRECIDCGARWVTFEYSEAAYQSIQKQQAQLIHATVDAQYAIKDAIAKLQQIKI